MKILSASFMALCSCAASAAAADLPSIKSPPPPPPPIFTWTGPYIGLNTGYLLKGNDSIDVATMGNIFSMNIESLLAMQGQGPVEMLMGAMNAPTHKATR